MFPPPPLPSYTMPGGSVHGQRQRGKRLLVSHTFLIWTVDSLSSTPCTNYEKSYTNFGTRPQFVCRRAQWEPCVVVRAMDSTRGIALGGWWPLCIAAWLAAPPARGDCLESEPPAGSGLEEISPSISRQYP